MNYTGVKVPIPFGKSGFDGSSDVDNLPPSALVLADNIRYDESLIRKAGGMTVVDSNAVTGTPTCLAGVDWWPTTSIQRQVTVWSNGKIYKEVSNDMDSVELGTGYTFTNPVVIVPCGQELAGNARRLLFFSKGVAPFVVTGDGGAGNATALTNVSANWTATNQPAAGIMHDNRVLTWGNPGAPHDIEFSALDDHTNFKSTNPADATSFPLPAFSIAPGEAEYINACHSIGTTRLYVFKHPAGIYFMDTDQMTSFAAPITTVRKDIGVAGPKAITKVGSLGTWFIGSDGHIYSLDMLNDPNADIRDTCITKAKHLKKWIKDNVLPNRLGHSQLIYDSNRGEVIASFTSVSVASTNDLLLIFDVNDPSNIKVSMDTRGTYFNALWFAKENLFYQQLITSGTSGLVYKMNQDERTIGTATAYSASAESPSTDLAWFDPGLGGVNKRFDWLEIRSITVSNDSAISVDVIIDDVYNNTYDFSAVVGGAALNDTAYGLTPISGGKTAFTLSADGYVRRFIKIGGVGRRIALSFWNDEAGGDFGIGQVYLYCQPLIVGAEA